MLDSITLLNRYAAHHQGASDYRIAKLLGCSKGNVSMWRHGKNTIGDEVALRIAGELGLPAAYVIAALHAERNQGNSTLHRMWTDLAKAARAAAAASVLILMGIVVAPVDVGASEQVVSGLYIMAIILGALSHYYLRRASQPPPKRQV